MRKDGNYCTNKELTTDGLVGTVVLGVAAGVELGVSDGVEGVGEDNADELEGVGSDAGAAPCEDRDGVAAGAGAEEGVGEGVTAWGVAGTWC